jgi:hypothetical protein
MVALRLSDLRRMEKTQRGGFLFVQTNPGLHQMKKSNTNSFFEWLLSHLLAPPPTIKRRRRVLSAGPNLCSIDRMVPLSEKSLLLSPDPPQLNFHALERDFDNASSEPSTQFTKSEELGAITVNADNRSKREFVIGSIKAEICYGYWGYSAWSQSQNSNEMKVRASPELLRKS